MNTIREIKGHPALEAEPLTNGRRFMPRRKALRITVCANCERMKSVLFLSKDRWFCTSCRSSGDARPTQVFFSNPSKRS